jgi:phage/plasmid-associated DNA primase
MDGLIEPDAVREATAKYREQSDQLGRFLAECTREKAGRSKSSMLFALFTAWSKATGGRVAAGLLQGDGRSRFREEGIQRHAVARHRDDQARPTTSPRVGPRAGRIGRGMIRGRDTMMTTCRCRRFGRRSGSVWKVDWKGENG